MKVDVAKVDINESLQEIGWWEFDVPRNDVRIVMLAAWDLVLGPDEQCY